MIVTLTEEEFQAANALGGLRNAWNVKKGHQTANNFTGENPVKFGDEVHRLAACAEAAFAKATGLPRNEKFGLRKEPSVGRYFVRATTRRDGHLLVQPGDPDDALVIFGVSTDLHTFDFRGWLRFGRGKTRANWARGQSYRPDRPAYWVRQRDLHPLHLIGLEPAPPAPPAGPPLVFGS